MEEGLAQLKRELLHALGTLLEGPTAKKLQKGEAPGPPESSITYYLLVIYTTSY